MSRVPGRSCTGARSRHSWWPGLARPRRTAPGPARRHRRRHRAAAGLRGRGRLLGRRQRPGLPASARPAAPVRAAVARCRARGSRPRPARWWSAATGPQRSTSADSRSGTSLTALAGLALTIQRSRHLRGDTRRALRVGLPTIPHQVALYLAGGALVLVAGHLYGTAEAGRLQLAVLIGSAPGVVTASLNNAWAPIVYRTEPAAPRRGARAHQPRHRRARGPGRRASSPSWPPPCCGSRRRAPTTPPSSRPRWASSRSAPCCRSTTSPTCTWSSRPAAARAWPSSPRWPCSSGWARRGSPGSRSVSRPSRCGMTVTYAVMAAGVARLARRVSPTRWRESRLAVPLGVGTLLCVLGAAVPAVGAVAGGALGGRGGPRRPLASSSCGGSSPAETDRAVQTVDGSTSSGSRGVPAGVIERGSGLGR